MAAVSQSILRRAMLYVPASSPRMLAKSLTLPADNITYDLEDSVTAARKPEARAALRRHLADLPPAASRAPGELAVRINAVSTPHALRDLADLAALDAVDAVVVPKVQSAADLTFVTDVLRHVAPARHHRTGTGTGTGTSPHPERNSAPGPDAPAGPVKIIALVESARAVMDLASITAASPYLSGLVFAAEDFALDLSLTRTPALTEFLYARSAVATAARAAGLASTIDLVCTSYRGDEGLARLADECRGGKGLGFNGKQCIHPSQLDLVQRLFAPEEAEVDWAVRVVVADDKAAAAGRGAWTLDGMMIDAPVTGKARAVVDKARRCGFLIEALRDKWKDQEPE